MLRFILRLVAQSLVVATLVLLLIGNAWCASYKVLYNFTSADANPSSGLITDAAGNAYGTTLNGGGPGGSGTVYELSPTSGYHLLYAFRYKGVGGWHPQGNLAIDSQGNLFGTTVQGGANKADCGGGGCGVVFELSPAGSGLWTETVLYNFCSQANCADGTNPQAGVVFDSAGNLYGTTKYGGGSNCGSLGCGTVFELQHGQSGWAETVLYTFMGNGADGGNPLGSLVFDGAGSLYGTASVGGPGAGSAFRLSPSQAGWTFSVIYAFAQSNRQDGNTPEAGMIFDAAGNLYGTTAHGGASSQGDLVGYGTVFELSPSAGNWAETILYNFVGGNDGAQPESNLVLDSSGSLYGTTFAGGNLGCNGNGCGTVFKLSPSQGAQWTESVFRFPLNGPLGLQPSAPVAMDKAGNIYGTATGGGFYGDGVFFRIIQ